MRLDKLVMKNFRCFGEEPTEVSFADGLTVIVGANGTGKTALLLALARMFGRSGRGRGLGASDFHTKPGAPASVVAKKTLWIDAWFSFPELEVEGATSEPAVAQFLNDFVTDQNGKQFLRIRLLGTLAPDGQVEEELLAITTTEADVNPDQQRPIRGSARSAIRVEYIPATRDPEKELSFTSRAVLGRLLQAVKVDEPKQKSIEDASRALSMAVRDLDSLKAIEKQIGAGWGQLHRGSYHNKAQINVTSQSLAELLGQATVRFAPSEQDGDTGIEHLSDGQRSLFYLSLTRAALTLEQQLADHPNEADSLYFDSDRVQSPVFTLIAVEEPENHLAPHYLGRILDLLHGIAKVQATQVILTTHAPGVARRCDPRTLRHLRLDAARRVKVGELVSRSDEETYKIIKNTLWANPEMLFARVVLLVEGDSERLVLPRLFRASVAPARAGSPIVDVQQSVDESFISVVPIAGRHTESHWRVLCALGIPFVTLIDLDSGRESGGISRINTQLGYIASGWYDHDVRIWASEQKTRLSGHSPNLSEVADLLQALEEKAGMFFSAPVDLDLMLICTFPEAYPPPAGRAKLKSWPEVVKEVLYNLIDAKDVSESCSVPPPITLSEHERNAYYALHGRVSGVYGESTWSKPFKLYEYHMKRSDRGKPLAHLTALDIIEDADLWENAPNVLKRLVQHVTDIAKTLPE